MNKSILKHEIKSMKWMSLLSILASLLLVLMFSLALDSRYGRMFSNGIDINQAIIKSALRGTTEVGLLLFVILAIVQIFMQFRSEKGQEIGRFLKSLPIKREEFFKIKLITGIINLSLAFLVLAIGIIIVRNNNMFWIKDIYSLSIIAEPFMKADGVLSLLKDLGLVYLIVINFYTFLFMIQYTFSNVVGGIVIGCLVYLAPIFIAIASMFSLEKLTSTVKIRNLWIYGIDQISRWLLPWTYAFEYENTTWIVDKNGMGIGGIDVIENLGIKYLIILVLILVNILIAYKFNKSSKVENENMVIPFKTSANIFKVGVTICSGLLVSAILGEIMRIQMSSIIYILFMVLGSFIGYVISNKITRVGTI